VVPRTGRKSLAYKKISGKIIAFFDDLFLRTAREKRFST